MLGHTTVWECLGIEWLCLEAKGTKHNVVANVKQRMWLAGNHACYLNVTRIVLHETGLFVLTMRLVAFATSSCLCPNLLLGLSLSQLLR